MSSRILLLFSNLSPGMLISYHNHILHRYSFYVCISIKMYSKLTERGYFEMCRAILLCAETGQMYARNGHSYDIIGVQVHELYDVS